MKKLIIALAAVVVSAAVQASSVNWTCTNVKDSSGNAIASGSLAYFIAASTDISSTILALEGKGASEVASALSPYYSYHNADAGKFTVDVANAVPVSDLGIADAQSYKAFLVVFDTASITDDSKFYVTAAKDLETLTGDYAQTVKFGSQSTPSTATGAWHDVASIPEPTSGLLLVLGMAGLALRRRRA